MRTIAIMNNKGGVGKTVTAINLADILSRGYGRRVVLVDCDGQMNLTRFFLPEFDPELNISVADVLIGDGEPLWEDNLLYLPDNIRLLPGSSGLYSIDLDTVQNNTDFSLALRDFAEAITEDDGADYLLFDCPPGFTAASVAALMAADMVVIPTTVDGFSISGMKGLAEQIKLLRKARNGIDIGGVLITQWHNSEVIHQGEQLLRSMGVPVYKQVIRRTDKVPESTFDQSPIVKYSPTSAASRDYLDWVCEFMLAVGDSPFGLAGED